MSKDIAKIASSVGVNLMDTQDHIKTLTLIAKYQQTYFKNESSFISDIEKNAVKYKEDSELMLECLIASLDSLYVDLSQQTQTLLDL